MRDSKSNARHLRNFGAYEGFLAGARQVRDLAPGPDCVPACALEPMRRFIDAAAQFQQVLASDYDSSEAGRHWSQYLQGHLDNGRRLFAGGAVKPADAYDNFGYLHNGIIDAFDELTA